MKRGSRAFGKDGSASSGLSPRTGSLRVAAALAVAFAMLMSVAAGVAQSQTTGWAQVFARPLTPAGSVAVGNLSSSTAVQGAVALKPRDPAALAAYAAAVTSPHSPLYGRYLAAGQFAARFGPAQGTIAAGE